MATSTVDVSGGWATVLWLVAAVMAAATVVLAVHQHRRDQRRGNPAADVDRAGGGAPSAAEVLSVANAMSGSAQNVVQAGRIDTVNVVASQRVDDIQLLREVTNSNLRGLADHASLPGPSGEIKVPRVDVATLLGVDGDFVVTGEPGCGKSGVLFELAQRLREQDEEVLLLTVESLGNQPGAIRDDVVLGEPLSMVLSQWTGERPANLLIDGLDAARGENLGWLATLVSGLRGTRWRTVATMRRFDLRHSRPWVTTFAGAPVVNDALHRADDLPAVRHYYLGNLTTDELASLAGGHLEIAKLLGDADDPLSDLIRNPFNLRLACDLLRSGVDEVTLAGARDQLELLQRYWQARVINQPDREARLRVLERLSQAMLEQRTLRASSEVVPDSLLETQTRLVSDGVLNEVPTRLRASGSAPLVYSHHILFDYAIAALVLASDGESRLTNVLDQDPNLVLVARPSIDLHLADLWHAEQTRTLFADVAFALARRRCVLVGVAAARILVTEVATPDDITWLAQPPPTESDDLGIVVFGWIAGVMEAADERAKRRIRHTIAIWVNLAAASTSKLVDSYQENRVRQTSRLLWQLNRVQPMRPGLPGAVTWADCVATLTRIALTDLERRQWLGTRLAMFLPWAVAITPGHAEVLHRTLQLDVFESWPPNYLYHYVEGIGAIATGDAEAARDVLLAVLGFDETSEDITVLTEGVLTLTSTRRQDVTSAKYAVGQHMPEFIAKAGLPLTTAVLAAAVQMDDSGLPGEVRSYPIRTASADGYVDLTASSLEFSPGHGAAEEIVNAYTQGMDELDIVTVDMRALVDDLVETIHHPEAWRHLVTTAARRPTELGLAFLPVFTSGGLLVHPDTRAAAGDFIKAVSPVLPPAEHAILEQAILAAPSLLNEPAVDRATRLLDQLASRLDPDRIQHPDLATRANMLLAGEGQPEIPEPADMEMMRIPDTLRDHLGDTEHDQLNDEQRETLDALRQAVDAAANNATTEQISTLEHAVRQALEADLGGHSSAVTLLVLRGASVLIHKARLDPGSDLAALIMPVLLDAARTTGEPGENAP
jgi:hypothetical protein